jgi:hypothetical protein
MAIRPPTLTAAKAIGGITIGGRDRRITRPFEDLREKEEKKKDDDEDEKRKHEPRR